ncbi:MAG: response regulator [Acidobacteriia bacterium]|nr:response regulator [Terriglobia bacterium]
MGDTAKSLEAGRTGRRSKLLTLPSAAQRHGSASGGESPEGESSASSVLRESRPTRHRSADLATERRVSERVWVSARVRVRAMRDAEGGPDEFGTTLNVSRTGFLFKSQPDTFTLGMPVRVTFPYVPGSAQPQAERSGCVVRVSNLPDGSCTVAVALASLGQGRTRTPAAKHVPSATDPHAPAPEKPVILAVDADAVVRASVKKHLGELGYKVIATGSCAEAAELLRGLTPAVLLVDPGVPAEEEDRPGLHLCRQIQCDPRLRSVPLMLLLSESCEGDCSDGRTTGAVVRLSKPCGVDRLGYVVRLVAPLPHDRQHDPLLAAAHPEPHARDASASAAPSSGTARPSRRYWLF